MAATNLIKKYATKQNLILGGVVIGTFLLAEHLFKKGVFTSFDTNVDTTSTTSTSTTVEGLKNQILDQFYRSALNPSTVIQNIEAIKSELNTYTQQLTNLAAEVTAGRIPQSTVRYYVKKIVEEIATKLKIEIRPANSYGGGYGRNRHGYGNGWSYGQDYGNYSDLYNQYLQQLMQYYQMMMQQGYGGYYPGYSMGYGYQQPNIQPIYPQQNYYYYPNQYAQTQPYPYYGGGGGGGGYYGGYPSYY